MLGTVNVEVVGGNLLIQHYLAKVATKNHVVMHSKRTCVFVWRLLPAIIEVIWTLQVAPKDGRSADFRCTVETRMSSLMTLVAFLGLLPLFLRWYVEDEIIGFARDISNKVGEGVILPGKV